MHSIRVFSLSPLSRRFVIFNGTFKQNGRGERMSGQLNGSLCFFFLGGGGLCWQNRHGIKFLGMYVYV